MTKQSETRPVVVTTQHRGVFVGYTADPPGAEIVTLERGRMIVYWPTDVHGVLGLATHGPLQGSRVSPAVKSITLRNVTAIIEASPAAAEQWEKEPWP